MVLDPQTNFGRSGVTSSIASGDTVIPVTDASVFSDAANGSFNVVIFDAAAGPSPSQVGAGSREVVTVTGTDTTNDELTVTRGAEGTSATSLPDTSVVIEAATGADFDAIDAALEDLADFAASPTEVTAPVNNGSVTTDALVGAADHIIRTTSDLESIFPSELSDGDTVFIGAQNAPYRTTTHLDIDNSGVDVIGAGVKELIKPADGADVGGFRIGNNAAVTDVTIRNVGYHGNESTMDDTVKSLEFVDVLQADRVLIQNNYATRTHPWHEHNTGGSGVSVDGTTPSSHIVVDNNHFFEIGDRAIEFSDGTLNWQATRNINISGYDRSVACGNATNGLVAWNYTKDLADGSCYKFGRSGAGPSRLSVIGNHARGAFNDFTAFQDGSEIVVANNTCDKTANIRTGGAAVKLVDATTNVSIVNNVFNWHDNNENGNAFTVSPSADQWIFANNYAGPGGGEGINVSGGDGVIQGNVLEGFGAMGINLNSSPVRIIGNRIRDCGRDAIRVFPSSDSNLIAFNSFANNNLSGGAGHINANDGSNVYIGNYSKSTGANAVGAWNTFGTPLDNTWIGNRDESGSGWNLSGDTGKFRDNTPEATGAGDGAIINGEVIESANAESPQGSYPAGTLVRFTDSGDGSGTGTYLITRSGGSIQIASSA